MKSTVTQAVPGTEPLYHRTGVNPDDSAPGGTGETEGLHGAPPAENLSKDWTLAEKTLQTQLAEEAAAEAAQETARVQAAAHARAERAKYHAD